MTTTEYPPELTDALAYKLAEELADRNVVAVSTTIDHEDGTDTYTLTVIYKRTGGAAC